MKLDRFSRIQLAIFAAVTVITVTAIAVAYLHVPAKLGLGSYRVSAEFVTGGGIYRNANVTYRGVTVGRVESVGLTDTGVVAQMRLNTNTAVPGNVTATVKSVSAVGEQYIDLVPPEGTPPSDLRLADGAVIGTDRTAVGQDIAGMLREADTLVSTINNSRLHELLAEAFTAFNGTGPELARLLRSSRQLVDAANADADTTIALIDQAGPQMDAQIRSGDSIRAIADGLARFTTELRGADPQVRTLLSNAPSVADAANTAFTGIRPNFPMLAANLANLGRIGVIYHKSIEQAFVIFPALIAALNTVAGGVPADEGGKLDFKIDLGDPPTCNVGFLPPTAIRSPADETLRDLPTDMYCKAAQNDPTVVRGARNYPCMEFPGKRAPTVQLCRDPKGFIPIGANPWRGPPIPYGSTPVTDDRNILPPNKFPLIPPGADYDPGPPVTQLPPGVQSGPGPAPNAPFPLPVPPNDNPPAPNGPFMPPADQYVPPYAQQPQAAGPQYRSYDNQGRFTDADGRTGIFAAGVEGAAPAENWVDLMLGPTAA
ncbi:mammalian cell entry protein [Mycolicibacterium insubricum]|uniref:Mammalian cell entry protein n=1 Tax=Mycolicibacterium insubricum TaxID=444597 RepID=A0A1X0D5Q4_9MYCO|nr:MCE family protein [Mycolicibacterium insubricum]MCB9438899.1 MCE family protein [Mycolicibacterium sp.]ORA67741.1 mammalian cell entry protein [Mycolicibacterium insubricum]BBZ68853.1 mammalian cell entry protein [Mycolicibacterium insubricum]